MKFTLVEMQAFEFVLLRLGMKGSAWYESQNCIFTPKFFKDDGVETNGYIKNSNGIDVPHDFGGGEKPLLFADALNECDYPQVRKNIDILKVARTVHSRYMADPDAALSFYGGGSFPISNVADVTFRDGFHLDVSELTQQDYELVGLQRS